MDPEKRKEIELELSKITILQLRDIARQSGIDISGSIRKKEVIDKILASDFSPENIAKMMIPGRFSREERKPAEQAKAPAEPEKIEKWTAEAAKKVEPVTEQKIMEVREYIRHVLTNKPSFFQIDAELEAAVAKHRSGDSYGAVRDIRKAREKASDLYSHFRIYTTALGIETSEKALEEAMRRGKMQPEDKKALMEAAMVGFVDGTPAVREGTLDRLESEALSSFDRIVADIGKDIEVRQNRAAELQGIGANVIEAVNLLKEAEKLKPMLKLDAIKHLLGRADELMKQAEKNRVEELRFSIPRVRASIEDAKIIGIDVGGPEKDLQKASYHFERGELKECVESLSNAGVVIDRTVTQRLASDAALKQGILDKAKAVIQQIAAPMAEVHSYGIDASEGFHYMSNMQIALNRQDAVSTMKFAKRAEELSNGYSAELKDLKDKAIHIDGSRCWQCGQDMLYGYPNGFTRCSNCGASMKRQ
jgi:hypothetical protein